MSPYKGFTDSHRRANAKYLAKMAQIKVYMSPEKRDAVRAYAQAKGMSVNGLINALLDGADPSIAAVGKAAEVSEGMEPAGEAETPEEAGTLEEADTPQDEEP